MTTQWSYDIDIKISGCGVEGKDEAEARKNIKAEYYFETGIELTDAEITNVVKFEGDTHECKPKDSE